MSSWRYQVINFSTYSVLRLRGSLTELSVYYSFIGGTYGRIIGKAMVDLFGVHTEGEWAWMDPGAFALIGAASFFGGVSRLTMSLTVIMVRAV